MSEDKKIDIDQIRIKPALFGYALVGLLALYLHYKGTTDKVDKLTVSVDALVVLVKGHDDKINATDKSFIAFNSTCEDIRKRIDKIEAILPAKPTFKRYKK